MGAKENIVANSSKIAYTTYFPIDQVVFSYSWTATMNNVVNTVPPFQTLTVGVRDAPWYGFVLGIYSYDGGTSWNDIGYGIGPGGLTKNPSLIVPSVGVGVESDEDGNVKLPVTVNSLVGAGSTFDLLLRIVVLDLGMSTDSVPSLAQAPTQSGKVSYSTVAFDSTNAVIQGQYRQILTENVTNAYGAASVTTVAHNLSAIPIGLFFIDDSSTNNRMYPVGRSNTSQGNWWSAANLPPGTSPDFYGVALDSTNMYFGVTNGFGHGPGANYRYRLYREN